MIKQPRSNFLIAAFLLVTHLSAGSAAAQNTWYG